jgi:sn-glycerol 3-phosphate transport system substrate-binding protein
MNRRTLLAGSAALAAAAAAPARAPRAQTAPVKIVWWHAMTAVLGQEVARLVDAFNASQSAYAVEAVFKGSYPDVLTATVAAFRAGQAPHLAQIFEVGTGSMLAAGRAVKQAWELSKETGVAIDPAAYIAPVRGYYSLPDGRMASVPFNSSTAVMWINKDAFRRAGLDPDHPPATWPEVVAAARALKAKDAAEVPMTTSWPTWIQLEEYGALHDVPFATRANGFEGLDTELMIAAPAYETHVQRLLDMAREGTFKYGGRDNAADPMLLSGKTGIAFNSSGTRGDLLRSAKFEWAPAFLPYDPQIIAQPKNSIIGGASLWTMTGPNRTPEEYKAVATFLQFLGKPENAAAWHQRTGYVPVTTAGFQLSREQGFYEKNKGADLPIEQLMRGTMDDNSRGLRLGRLPEIRNIIQEELERALQSGGTAKQVLAAATERGNKVLREFEKSARA